MMTNHIALKTHDDTGKLVVRVALATLLLFHGVSKLTVGGGFVSTMLAKAACRAFSATWSTLAKSWRR